MTRTELKLKEILENLIETRTETNLTTEITMINLRYIGLQVLHEALAICTSFRKLYKISC